jgi:hypothetical protein
MVNAMILQLQAWLSSVPMWLRQLMTPGYRPELHYMRGPGPACARLPRRQNPSDRDGR